MKKEHELAMYAGSLALTVAVAWYFSRNKSGSAIASESVSPDDGSTQAPSYLTFNMPPINIPPITSPTFGSTGGTTGGTSSGSGGSCCRNCGGTSGTTAAPSPGSLVSPAVSVNTLSFGSSVSNTAPSNVFEPLILPNSGGEALPNPVLWQRDADYRTAYLMAYNAQIDAMKSEIMDECVGFNVPASCWHGDDPVKLDMTLADNDSPDAVMNVISTNLRGGIHADEGSQLYAAMLQAVTNNLQLFGDDPNKPTSAAPIGSGLIPL